MHLRSPRKPIKRALALEYDGVGAPRLTAKGAGEIAEKIIAIAQEAEVPLYEDPHLAAALSQLELGDPVPELLYRAIAEVLAFVYDMERLQEKMAAHKPK
ncbi:EscU/YscU/HrcU family type III secretion system export apparatus switch protein [Marinospirillum sp. MEB164]|uniref:Flagellar biosynthetic protein FlhB n=1 Tax=Marinospirillum alkalitolerans TaxID=3123374 RepID=A0ABW8PV77_9GAMM